MALLCPPQPTIPSLSLPYTLLRSLGSWQTLYPTRRKQSSCPCSPSVLAQKATGVMNLKCQVQAGNVQSQSSCGSDKPLSGSASIAVVSLVPAQRIPRKALFHKGKGEKWHSDTCTHLVATKHRLPARGQALLEGSARDQKRLESQSGLF